MKSVPRGGNPPSGASSEATVAGSATGPPPTSAR